MRQVCIEGPGHYLGSQQTLALMQRDYFYPVVGDRANPKEWAEQGRTDIVERASARVASLLGGHFPAHLAAVDRRSATASRSACQKPRCARLRLGSPHDPHRPRGRHRRRGGRLQRALPSGAARLDRLPAAGDERADLRLDLACRRQLPDLLRVVDRDEDAGLLGELYRRLSAELEGGIGYHVTGSLRLAHHRERMDEFRHVVAMARAQGMAFDLLTPTQARELYPFLETHDLEGALWDPMDGDIDPSQLTQAYARLRPRGRLPDRPLHPGHQPRPRQLRRMAGRHRQGRTIRAEIVVNAAGYRAGEIMALLGRHVPIVAMQHQYPGHRGDPGPGRARAGAGCRCCAISTSPTISARSATASSSGPTSGSAAPSGGDGIPADFAYQLLPDDLDRLERYIEDACARVPILAEGGVKR